MSFTDLLHEGMAKNIDYVAMVMPIFMAILTAQIAVFSLIRKWSNPCPCDSMMVGRF